jgi:hypothetical protein
LSIMTLVIMTFSKSAKKVYLTSSITRFRIECRYAESCILFIAILIVIMLSGIMLSILGRSFPLSLMFVGKARTLPQSEAPKSCLTRVCSGITHKH